MSHWRISRPQSMRIPCNIVLRRILYKWQHLQDDLLIAALSKFQTGNIRDLPFYNNYIVSRQVSITWIYPEDRRHSRISWSNVMVWAICWFERWDQTRVSLFLCYCTDKVFNCCMTSTTTLHTLDPNFSGFQRIELMPICQSGFSGKGTSFYTNSSCG